MPFDVYSMEGKGQTHYLTNMVLRNHTGMWFESSKTPHFHLRIKVLCLLMFISWKDEGKPIISQTCFEKSNRNVVCILEGISPSFKNKVLCLLMFILWKDEGKPNYLTNTF